MDLDECQTLDTGWANKDFSAEGARLRTGMRWLNATQEFPAGPETMLAVLDGGVTLACDDEVHSLKAGQGALIPEQTPFRVEVAAPTLIYSVSIK